MSVAAALVLRRTYRERDGCEDQRIDMGGPADRGADTCERSAAPTPAELRWLRRRVSTPWTPARHAVDSTERQNVELSVG
jgi:hypothetical protein